MTTLSSPACRPFPATPRGKIIGTVLNHPGTLPFYPGMMKEMIRNVAMAMRGFFASADQGRDGGNLC
jgi:hypothetical protein